MSLIQRKKGDDGEDFISAPLAAAIFGQKKVVTSPLRTAIEIDIKFLQELGPTSSSLVGQGVDPRIYKLVKNFASKIADGKVTFQEVRPLLEFVASRRPETWLRLADLVSELPTPESSEMEMEYLRRYIEANPNGANT